MNLKNPLALATALRVIARTLDESLATGSIANARAALAESERSRQLEDEFAPAFDGVQTGVTLPG